MKKTALLLLLSLASISYAQDKIATDTIAKNSSEKSVPAKFEFGFVGHVNDDFNLNKKLSKQNLPQLNGFLPGFTVGWNASDDKFSTGFYINGLFGSSSKNNQKLSYGTVDIGMYFYYNLINKDNFALAGGLSTAYALNSYLLYEDIHNTIDLDNITPVNTSVGFYNNMFYLGPSASAYLFKRSKSQLRLNAGYEFALTRGRYHSYNAEILNNIGEAGNNRIVFGATLITNWILFK